MDAGRSKAVGDPRHARLGHESVSNGRVVLEAEFPVRAAEDLTRTCAFAPVSRLFRSPLPSAAPGAASRPRGGGGPITGRVPITPHLAGGRGARARGSRPGRACPAR